MPLPSVLSTLRDFRQPVLVNKSELYIEYYVRNPYKPTQELRKRIRLNHLKGTKRQRLKEANKIMFILHEKLKNGWNPILEKKNPKSFTVLSVAIANFLKDKRDLRADTLRTYGSFLKIYAAFQMNTYKTDLYVTQLDKRNAVNFLNYIYNVKRASVRTYNNYILMLRTFFNWLIEQDYTNHNPYKKITTKPKEMKHRMYINDAQRMRIKSYLLSNNLRYYYVVMFSYFTLLRRKEITFLKVKHVDLRRKLLYVEGYFTKNKKSEYITIPNPLIDYFKKIELQKFDRNYYLFSADLLPGKNKLAPKRISDLWLKMRKELQMPNSIQFMSLRDTGIRNLLRQGVSIDDVCKHARHSTIEVTKTYLFHDEVIAHESILKANQF